MSWKDYWQEHKNPPEQTYKYKWHNSKECKNHYCTDCKWDYLVSENDMPCRHCSYTPSIGIYECYFEPKEGLG